jgi:hypothetical protein
MSTPATAVANLINASAYGTLGSDLFIGPQRPQDAGSGVPAQASFVLATGGVAPSIHLGGTGELRFPTVAVLVRSAPEEFSAGYTRAKNIFETVHNADITGYVACLAENSEALYIGTDEQGCHVWSIRLALIVRG